MQYATNKIIDRKILITKFEIMLYALPDDFFVYVGTGGEQLSSSYKVTRSRKMFNISSDPKRYRQLVSPTEMYDIIKRHLEYEINALKSLENSNNDTGQHSKDRLNELEEMTRILEDLKRPETRLQTLHRLQPRWTPRSDKEDDLYDEAVSFVARTQITDVTSIRDQLSIGSSHAESIVQRLEGEGLVSTLNSNALKRRVLITTDDLRKRKESSKS
ncbi:MAG: DNA translocase FtsK [Acidobacteriota bacterium]